MRQQRSPFDNLPDLVQLYPTHERRDAVEADIIAIHGLGSNPLTTWIGECKDADNRVIRNVSWLSDQDMLPSLVPNARVWSFRYDSRWLGASPQQRLFTLADKLLALIEERMKTPEGKIIPIVWVCHSFGGLVLEQVLVNANVNAQYRDVVERTTGMVFLGTPFSGSDSAGWALHVVAAARALGYDAHKDLLEVLKPNSDALFDLKYQFELISRQMDYKIICFFEQLPTSYFKFSGLSLFKKEIIVPEQHAYVGGATKYSLNTTHRDMNEYYGPNDVNFKAVAGRLAAIVQESPNILQKRSGGSVPATPVAPPPYTDKPAVFFMLPYLRNSNFRGRGDIMGELDSHLTFQEDFHSRVAIYGLGGVGKSQIATEYLYRFREKNPSTSIFWVHAASRERFEQSYLSIAQLAGVRFSDEQDEDKLARTMAWLQSSDSGQWLMVVDNADDREVMMGSVQDPNQPLKVVYDLMHYIPEVSHGAVMFTTRQRSLGYDLADGKIVEVPRLEADHCESLLMGMLDEKLASKEDLKELIEAMEQLPLALVQAASFMARNSETVRNYLDLFNGSKDAQIELLNKQFRDLGRKTVDRRLGDTPRTVLTTWVVSFQRIQQEDPLAATILKVMSFYEKQDVPRELLPRENASDVQFSESLGTLQAYSLISPSLAEKAFDMHRLVQVATGKYLEDNKEAEKWLAIALQIITDNFPDPEPETFAKCARYLPHAQSVIQAFLKLMKEDRAGIRLLLRIGEYRHYRGHQNAAAGLFSQAITLAKAVGGPEDELTLEGQTALALAWNDMGRFNEALELGTKVAEIRLRLFGEEDRDLLNVQNNIGLSLLGLGRYKEALELQRKVLVLQTKVLGPDNASTISSEGNIAFSLWSLGNVDEAREMEERILVKRRNLLGELHPHYLTSLNNLALSYYNLGMWKEAEKLEVEVLEGRKVVLGPEHPDTLTALNNLALTYQSFGKLKESEELQEQVIEAQKRLIGPTHPDTLSAMGNLAFNWWLQERYDEAEKLEKFVLDARVKEVGEDHPSALLAYHNYCGTLRSCGRLKEAEKLAEQTLARLRRVLGNNHSLTLQSILEVAVIYWDLDKIDEAFVLEKEATEAYQRIFGPDHPDALTATSNLAFTYNNMGEHAKAMEMIKDVIARRKLKLGDDHVQTQQALDVLAQWEEEAAERAAGEIVEEEEKGTKDSLVVPGQDDDDDGSSVGYVSGGESADVTDVEGESPNDRATRESRRKRRNQERMENYQERKTQQQGQRELQQQSNDESVGIAGIEGESGSSVRTSKPIPEDRSAVKVEVEEFVPRPLVKRRTLNDPPEVKSIAKEKA